jgi:hypothetical protein
VRELQARVAAQRLSNVKVSLGHAGDPGLSAGAFDAVLISDAYHEMVEHKRMLRAIRSALKPAGRLVILEKMVAKYQEKPRDFQIARHQIAMSSVESELAEGGFSVVDRIDHFAEVPAAYTGGVLWLLIAVRK